MAGQRRQGGDEPVDVVCAAAESQAGAYRGPGRAEPGQQRVSAEAAVPHADAVLSGQVLRDQRCGPAVDGEAHDADLVCRIRPQPQRAHAVDPLQAGR